MNGRTIYKLLRRQKFYPFFGLRHFFVVRVPLDVYPEPLPKFDLGVPNLESAGLKGYWKTKGPDEDATYYIISEYSGVRKDKAEIPEGAFDVQGPDENSPNYYFRCREGRIVKNGETIGEIPKDIIDAYYAQEEWEHRNIFGMLGYRDENGKNLTIQECYRRHDEWYGSLNPIHRALIDACNDSKTVYVNHEDNAIVLTFSIKPYNLREACNSLSRAMKAGKGKLRQIKGK